MRVSRKGMLAVTLELHQAMSVFPSSMWDDDHRALVKAATQLLHVIVINTPKVIRQAAVEAADNNTPIEAALAALQQPPPTSESASASALAASPSPTTPSSSPTSTAPTVSPAVAQLTLPEFRSLSTLFSPPFLALLFRQPIPVPTSSLHTVATSAQPPSALAAPPCALLRAAYADLAGPSFQTLTQVFYELFSQPTPQTVFSAMMCATALMDVSETIRASRVGRVVPAILEAALLSEDLRRYYRLMEAVVRGILFAARRVPDVRKFIALNAEMHYVKGTTMWVDANPSPPSAVRPSTSPSVAAANADAAMAQAQQAGTGVRAISLLPPEDEGFIGPELSPAAVAAAADAAASNKNEDWVLHAGGAPKMSLQPQWKELLTMPAAPAAATAAAQSGGFTKVTRKNKNK